MSTLRQPQRGATARGPMRRGFYRLLPVSLADGQAIPGWARPVGGSGSFWWGNEHFPASLRALHSPSAAPRMHQSGALLHAIRLTSNSRSLQSP